MQYKLAIFLASLCMLSTSGALRILLLFPMMTKSHSILGNGFANRLLEAGHEVVHVTSFPSDKKIHNLKEVHVSSLLEMFKEVANKSGVTNIKNIVNSGQDSDSITFVGFTYYMHYLLLADPNLVAVLSNPDEKFDAVILEWFFSESTAGIANLFQCPLIWSASTEPHWQVLRLIDGIPNPAYTVDLFSFSTPPLNFWERTMELYKLVKKYLISWVIYFFEWYLYNSVYTELAAKRGVEMPSYSEAIYNGSLLFVNSHPSIGSSFKLPQNAINIGGYHISDKVKPLPKELQKIMDEAKHGVIYYSMGSSVKSSTMSDNMKQSLLKIFGNLQETVIWKFEAEMDNVPANVHLVKWAPQQSILAHKKLKFFITHGGLLSTTESLYYGIPLIGLPVMGDQNLNMKTVVQKGYGIKVTLGEDMAEELTVAIKEMLSNSSYTLRAKELSRIFHDRPVAPGKELVHWVEHVVKTRGALHLRSPALHVPLYQKLYLDLLAVIVLIISVLYKIIRKVMMTRTKLELQTKKDKSS